MRRKLLLAGGIAAVVLVAVGVVLLVNGIDGLGDTRLSATRTPVGDEREIRLKAEKYVVYYEVDDEFAPEGEETIAVPDLDVQISGEDGENLDESVYFASFNVSSGGRYAQAMSTVEPSQAGEYELTADGAEGDGDPAVVLGEPVSGRLTGFVAGIVAILVGLGVGLFALIAGLLGRRRANKAHQGAGNPAPPGY